jgi:hypothetical protein
MRRKTFKILVISGLALYVVGHLLAFAAWIGQWK